MRRKFALYLMLIMIGICTSCQSGRVSTNPETGADPPAKFTSPAPYSRVFATSCPQHGIILTLSREAAKRCSQVEFMYAIPDRTMIWHKFAVATPYDNRTPMSRIGVMTHRMKIPTLHGQMVLIHATVVFKDGSRYDVPDLVVTLSQLPCDHGIDIKDDITGTVNPADNNQIVYADQQ